MSKRLTVAIDFDGVLADYRGWKGELHLDPPMVGAPEFVQRVIDAGYDVVIFTTGARFSERTTAIHGWLKKHGFPEGLTVTNVKPPALVYIDDRGFRFTGNWEVAFKAINALTHWQMAELASLEEVGLADE